MTQDLRTLHFQVFRQPLTANNTFPPQQHWPQLRHSQCVDIDQKNPAPPKKSPNGLSLILMIPLILTVMWLHGFGGQSPIQRECLSVALPVPVFSQPLLHILSPTSQIAGRWSIFTAAHLLLSSREDEYGCHIFGKAPLLWNPTYSEGKFLMK